MKIGILGTGMVGNALATKLVQAGHEVMMGSRSADTDDGRKWVQSVGNKGKIGTFADAASFGELIISCTNGMHSMEALQSVGAEPLLNKILIDVSNPLQQDKDGAMILGFCNTDSLGERIQKAFPQTRVVKALNTVNCDIMIEPSRVPGDHNLFICGNDAAAKKQITQYLSDSFGWKPDNIIDVGDITAARGTEMMMPLWIRLFQGVIGHPHFNWQIVRGQ
jgi:predicted dinucleotide-binding enzyme